MDSRKHKKGESPQELRDYIEKSNFGRKTKYSDYKTPILLLLKDGASQQNIIDWLAEEPRYVIASQSSLSRWLTKMKIGYERRLISTSSDQSIDESANSANSYESKTEALESTITSEKITARASEPWNHNRKRIDVNSFAKAEFQYVSPIANQSSN